MNNKQAHTRTRKKASLLIKKCHLCGHLNEGHKEPERCGSCNKSFLPSHYFAKVHAKNSHEFKELFSSTEELHEEDLIKGLHVLW